jgi:mRNA-degrading endonuclease RelE of RelBE toxin-antitoxin system
MCRYGEQLEYTPKFLEAYDKLSPVIRKKTDQQLQRLVQDSSYPSLQVKKVKGWTGIWEARVDYHHRITFEWGDNGIRLRAVGTHEVYLSP